MAEKRVQNASILLVEDSPLLAEAEREFFSREGFHVRITESGEECINLIQHGAEFDMIVLDVSLGSGIDGIETAKMLLAIKELPILFLTNHDDPETLKRIGTIPAYGYVLKSSGVPVIVESIKTALNLYKRYKAIQQQEHNYQELVENQSDLVVKVNDKGKFIYVNPSYCDLFGLDQEELIGNMFMSLVHPEDRKITSERMEKLKYPPHSCYVEQRSLTKFGWRWISWMDTALINEKGDIRTIICVGRDIHDRKIAEERLNKLTKMFVTLGTDQDANIRYITRKTRQLLQATCAIYIAYDREEHLLSIRSSDGLCSDLPTTSAPEETICYERTFRQKQKPTIIPDLSQESFKGSESLIKSLNLKSYIGYPVVIDGNTIGSLCVFSNEYRNFTSVEEKICKTLGQAIAREEEQKHSADRIQDLLNQKELLLREVHHRIKNNMHSITSLLSLQKQRMNHPEAAEALQEAGDRVNIMLEIYERLYTSDNINVVELHPFVQQLIRDIQESYEVTNQIEIQYHLDQVSWSSRNAFPLGIIINELITNAYKYAFKDFEKGWISIQIRTQDLHSLSMEIRDNGSGYPEEVLSGEKKGFGLTLVDLFCQQLGGKAEFSNDDGAVAQVVVRDKR